MSIPVNLLRYAGVWNNITRYSQYDFVLSPLNNLNYIWTGVLDLVGGADPSVAGNPLWVLYDPIAAPVPIAHGSYSSTQTQNIAGETILTYDTLDITQVGMSLVAPANNAIVLTSTGLYKVLASVQLNRTMGGNQEIDMYPKIQAVAVPNSASKLNINQNEESIMTVEWFLPITGGQTLQIALYSSVAGNQALAVAAAPPVPAIPSIILTIVRIA